MARTSHNESIVPCPIPTVTQMVTPNTLATLWMLLYANAFRIRRYIAQSNDQQFLVTSARFGPKIFGRRAKDSSDIILRRLRNSNFRHYVSGPISLA